MGCWWIAANGTWIAAIHDSEGGETCVNILQYQVHLTRHWNYKPPTTTINRWNNPISIVCAPSPIRQLDQTVATFENCTLSKFNFSMLKKCPHHVGKVPQHFATQFERPFAQVAHVYNAWLPYVLSDVIQAIFFFDLWKRYQVCREVDSPGQSGSGNQDLGPRPVVIDHNTFCVSEKHRISYDNLYSCIRSKSVNCQIVVIFEWQWTYMTWNKKQLVLCQRTRISSKCGSTYINLLSNFAWAGSFLIMLHHSSASINHP